MDKADKIKVTFEVTPNALRTTVAVLAEGNEEVFNALDKIISDTGEVTITDELLSATMGARFALSSVVVRQLAAGNKIKA